MTTADSGMVRYQDQCSNGANISDNAKIREDFIKAMLANPLSKLAQLKSKLLLEIGDDSRGEGVFLGDRFLSFHDRDGCGSSLNAYSFVVLTVTGGNSNHAVSCYLVTLNDDENEGVRTLSLLTVQQVDIRD